MGSYWFGEAGTEAPRRWFIEPNLQPYISMISQISTTLLVWILGRYIDIGRRYIQYIDAHRKGDVLCT